MTYSPPTTNAIEALHHVAETIETWLAQGEFACVGEVVRMDLESLPAALRAVGRELGQ
jgi:hypothetical protein